MPDVVEIDMRELQVTPFFELREIENIPKSQAAGHLVKELREVVQVRIAGSTNYSPVFPADGFYKNEGGNVITYRERWADAYRRFKEGSPQEAEGTPIAVLSKYGITPEEQSLCRTFKIYSVEALYALEGDKLKSLGMAASKLKEKAKAFMHDRMSGEDALKQIEELKAQLAAMQGGKANPVPAKDPTEEEMNAALIETMDEEELRGYIERVTGARPDGRLGIESLRNMAKSL